MGARDARRLTISSFEDDEIETFLRAKGYPARKLKWYRGGMQNWLSVGLSVEIPSPVASTR